MALDLTIDKFEHLWLFDVNMYRISVDHLPLEVAQYAISYGKYIALRKKNHKIIDLRGIQMSVNKSKSELDRLNAEIEAELIEYLEDEANKVEVDEKRSDKVFYIIVIIVFLIILAYRLAPLIGKYIQGL